MRFQFYSRAGCYEALNNSPPTWLPRRGFQLIILTTGQSSPGENVAWSQVDPSSKLSPTDWSFSASFTWVKTNTDRPRPFSALYGDCQAREHFEFDSHDLVIVTAGGTEAGDNLASGLTPPLQLCNLHGQWRYMDQEFSSLSHRLDWRVAVKKTCYGLNIILWLW